MTKYVNVQYIGGCIGSEHSSEQFGSWYEDYCLAPSHLLISGTSGGDFPIDDNAKRGDRFILVYVTYGTGDSFGSASGKVIEVALFNEDESSKVKELCELIKKKNEENPDDTTPIEYEGRTIGVWDWSGYFESLESVDYAILEIR